jgi:hypothetical protein
MGGGGGSLSSQPSAKSGAGAHVAQARLNRGRVVVDPVANRPVCSDVYPLIARLPRQRRLLDDRKLRGRAVGGV